MSFILYSIVLYSLSDINSHAQQHGMPTSCLSTRWAQSRSARSNIPGHTYPEAIIQRPPECDLDIFQHHIIRNDAVNVYQWALDSGRFRRSY